MKLYVKKEECCGCGACKDACEAGAVSMVQDREGFWYPRIKQSLCVNCGRCRQVCPIKHGKEEKRQHRYFGVWARDEQIRHDSSSGGIFPVMAGHIFSLQGVVYGAAYDDHMNVVHKPAENDSQLQQLKRTKYVQSDMTGIYRSIESRLKEGRWVLFCGTACQASALKLFLNREYEKLIIVDLVCYGVPSPGIWKKYVTYLEDRHGGKMTEFSFRDKRNRDHGRMRSYVIDGTEYVDPHGKDEYCLMYFRNYILRPSCHACEYCRPERDSDITIGDFWGIEKIKPEMDDGMGTSLVILHSEKGRALWDVVKDQILTFECEKKDVLQPRLQSPTGSAKGRTWFMLLYGILPFSTIVKIVADVRSRRIFK